MLHMKAKDKNIPENDQINKNKFPENPGTIINEFSSDFSNVDKDNKYVYNVFQISLKRNLFFLNLLF